MNMRTMLAAATAAAALYAVPASAVTVVTPGTTTVVEPNTEYTGSSPLLGGETINWQFTVGSTPVFIDNFAFSGTGTAGGTRLADVRFGIDTPTMPFGEITSVGNVAGGVGFEAGGTFEPGESFSLVFENLGDEAVSVTSSFETAAVPVPAGGLMLMGALGAGAAVARRRKQKTDA